MTTQTPTSVKDAPAPRTSGPIDATTAEAGGATEAGQVEVGERQTAIDPDPIVEYGVPVATTRRRPRWSWRASPARPGTQRWRERTVRRDDRGNGPRVRRVLRRLRRVPARVALSALDWAAGRWGEGGGSVRNVQDAFERSTR